MTGVPGGVLVVGYGNELRSDDGVGPAIADRLARDPRLAADPRLAGVDVRTAHQLTPELAFDMSRVSLLVLVDAAEDRAPGTVSVRRVEATDEAGPAMTHQIDPAALAGLARELFGFAPSIVTVGVGAATFEVGETLSPVVEDAVPRAVEAVVAAIAEHGRA